MLKTQHQCTIHINDSEIAILYWEKMLKGENFKRRLSTVDHWNRLTRDNLNFITFPLWTRLQVFTVSQDEMVPCYTVSRPLLPQFPHKVQLNIDPAASSLAFYFISAKQGAAPPTKTNTFQTATHWTTENQQSKKTINQTPAWLQLQHKRACGNYYREAE